MISLALGTTSSRRPEPDWRQRQRSQFSNVNPSGFAHFSRVCATTLGMICPSSKVSRDPLPERTLSVDSDCSVGGHYHSPGGRSPYSDDFKHPPCQQRWQIVASRACNAFGRQYPIRSGQSTFRGRSGESRAVRGARSHLDPRVPDNWAGSPVRHNLNRNGHISRDSLRWPTRPSEYG